jgi:hypothetical protein
VTEPVVVKSAEDWLASAMGADYSERLLQRLARHGLGEEEMSATEIKAATEYLRKTIGDRKSVEISGKNGAPITVVLAPTDRAL